MPVICPDCGAERIYRAAAAACFVRRGTFTGRCKHHRRPLAGPLHPLVDWAKLRRKGSALVVAVTCPLCQEERQVNAALVRKMLEDGTFTGRCKRHCWFGKTRGRKPRPEHPDVDWNDRMMVTLPDGSQRLRGVITCPVCRERRPVTLRSLEQMVRWGTLDARCAPHRVKVTEFAASLRAVAERRDRSFSVDQAAQYLVFAGKYQDLEQARPLVRQVLLRNPQLFERLSRDEYRLAPGSQA